MIDTLSRQPHSVECGIVNFNTSSQPCSHWVCYYRNICNIIYFDSYGQITPVEIQRHLKTGIEFARSKEVTQINTDIIQAANIPVCGHLCLFVLKSIASGGEKFQTILDHMQHYGPDPIIPCTCNWIQKIEITRVENQKVIVKC